MTEIELFVSEYGEAGHGRVAFAWNGKHAKEFVDANQTFRTAVVKYVCENPGRASTGLLSDLLRAESQWAREAWGAPHSYAELAALVLGRGGSDALEAFLDCYAMSFDRFGASHQMRIDVVSLASLCDEVKRRIMGGFNQPQAHAQFVANIW